MTKKILFVPLDERPCNYQFPVLMPNAGYELVLPERSLLGQKKRPADTIDIANWLKEKASGVDILIVAMDMLLYGGLIPSRLHGESREILCSRADYLKQLKQINPCLKIYAFQTIMRCARFSSDDEEPDYYARCGADIHRYGVYFHKSQLGIITKDEEEDYRQIKRRLPNNAYEDYISRRETNLNALLHTIDLYYEGVIDELIIAQDDSAPYGFTALDQRVVKDYIKEKRLQLRVPVYPGADEVGMTLLARAVNEKKRPRVYVYYASANGAFVVPCFEDRSLDATVKNHILAAGCTRVYSICECDIMLAVNVASEMLYQPSPAERYRPYEVERSLPELIDQIKYALSIGKVVAVADGADPIASEKEFVELLRDEDLLLKIHAYAGWNTSSNTLGTVLCEACLYLEGRDERGNRDFLLHRYYDDVGYCSHTRTYIDETAVPQNGCTVFALDGERGKCTAAAKEELLRYMRENYPTLAAYVSDIDVTSPWNRTFEMQFTLQTKETVNEKNTK